MLYVNVITYPRPNPDAYLVNLLVDGFLDVNPSPRNTDYVTESFYQKLRIGTVYGYVIAM